MPRGCGRIRGGKFAGSGLKGCKLKRAARLPGMGGSSGKRKGKAIKAKRTAKKATKGNK